MLSPRPSFVEVVKNGATTVNALSKSGLFSGRCRHFWEDAGAISWFKRGNRTDEEYAKEAAVRREDRARERKREDARKRREEEKERLRAEEAKHMKEIEKLQNQNERRKEREAARAERERVAEEKRRHNRPRDGYEAEKTKEREKAKGIGQDQSLHRGYSQTSGQLHSLAS